MRRYIILPVLILIGLMFLAPLAMAAALEDGELAGVFPEYPGDSKDISRGEFAALLVKAAAMQDAATVAGNLPGDVDPEAWYAPALFTLWEKGIIRGYPDGTLKAEGRLSNLEAAVMVARSLGLPDGVQAAAGVTNLDQDNWGFVPYSWLLRQGIVVDPAEMMQVGGAVKFLARVFGNDAQAEAIAARAQQAQANAQGISFNGEMEINLYPRDGWPDLPSEMEQMAIKAHMANEIIMPSTIHQIIKIEIPFIFLPTVGGDAPAVMEIEQYLVDGVMYQKITDPQIGEPQWMRMPAGLMPDVEEMIKMARELSLSQQVIPEELQRYFHYQLRGITEVNGRKVYDVGLYGRIDDLSEFINTAMGLLMPQAMQEMQEGIGIFTDLIRYISFWSTEYIGVDDDLIYGGQVWAIFAFNDGIPGEEIPFDMAEFEFKMNEYKYDADLIIELPQAAREAEEIPLPNAEQSPTLPAGDPIAK